MTTTNLHTEAILVVGQFTEVDLYELLQTIRRIEQRHPEVHYKIAASNKDMSMEQALDLLKNTFPYVEGQEPTFTTRKNEKGQA